MFTEVTSFVVNSFFCKKNGDSSEIEYRLDIPQEYTEAITHFSVVAANIPATFTQLDSGDTITLSENSKSTTVVYTPGTFKTKANAMLDLQNKLSAMSPNQFTYQVTDSNIILDDGAMKITCSDNTQTKNISFNGKYLQYIYGLNQTNSFITSLTGTFMNLNPISTIYIHSNICSTFNTSGMNTADIIAAIDISQCGKAVYFDMYHNMKPFSGQQTARFKLTDFDNFYLDLSNNDWLMTINLYSYQETWIHRLNHFLTIAAHSLDQKEELKEEHDQLLFNNAHILSHFFKKEGDHLVPIRQSQNLYELD